VACVSGRDHRAATKCSGPGVVGVIGDWGCRWQRAGGRARGWRFDDPAFAIDWPAPVGERTISERGRSYPGFSPET
jgi:hypothetical protein